MMQPNKNFFIDVSQLCIGIYVHLDLGWMDHPFTTSNFKIKNEEQLAKIKSLGLKRLRYDPERSDHEPLPAPTADKPVTEPPVTATANVNPTSVPEPILDQTEHTQEQHLQRLIQMHKTMDECEKKFVAVSNTAKLAMKEILIQPQQSIEHAELLVNEMVDSALNESEIAIIAINGNRSTDHDYVHSLNTTVLSMMMARSLNMTDEEARILGIAALFHDIGKAELSDKVLLKKEPLTHSEQTYFERHCELGAQIAKKSGLSDRIVSIILQHHELADGSGYPLRLKAERTDPLARLLVLINHYDGLCNPHNITLAKTPYEALAHMFAHQRSKFDEALLKQLIKSLGVYPPGSVVQLSNGLYGVVISVNPSNPLRPVVMLYDTESDNKPPLIICLRENPDLSISICIRPNQLPEDALNYLNPRKRISYFLDKDLSSESAQQ